MLARAAIVPGLLRLPPPAHAALSPLSCPDGSFDARVSRYSRDARETLSLFSSSPKCIPTLPHLGRPYCYLSFTLCSTRAARPRGREAWPWAEAEPRGAGVSDCGVLCAGVAGGL